MQILLNTSFLYAVLLRPAGRPSGSLQFCVHACDNQAAAIVIDPIALAAVIILVIILVCGVKESFWFNALTVAISLVAILMAIFLGEFPRHTYMQRSAVNLCMISRSFTEWNLSATATAH
jgi:amino acid transporter